MPRERRYTAHLPPANVTDRLLRRIDEAIPDLLRDNLSWDVGIGDDTIKAEQIDAFLAEISSERRFDDLYLEAQDNEEDGSFYLTCDSNGSSILYSCAIGRESAFRSLALAVEDLFRAHPRWTARIPRVLAHPRALFRTSALRLGEQPPSLFSQLDRKRITEDIVSRVVAHFLTAGLGGVAGFATGFFVGKFA